MGDPDRRGRRSDDGRDPHAWRRLTAARRALPGLVVVGAQRAGTTSLHGHLARHPQLVPAIRKEVHYFDDDARHARGASWYRAHFPFAASLADAALPRIAFESTPAYMFRPEAAPRLAALLPQARLVAVLRDPVERAISNWRLLHEKGANRFAPFDVEIEHELASEEGRPGPLGERTPRGLIARGRYAEQLERLWAHHPRERTLVLHSADLYADPQATCDRVFAWLGLPSAPVRAERRLNASVASADVSDALRARLRAYFEPHDRRLWELLGEEWDWDRAATPR